MVFWSYVGLFVVFYVARRFVIGLGKSLPVLELMLLIAGLQWVVGPIIEYNSPSFHWKYFMYVEQSEYMSYVVPGYTVLTLVIVFLNRFIMPIKLDQENLKNYSKFGLKLIFIGLFFDIVSGSLPRSLNFLIYILSSFKYVGAILLFFSEDKRLRLIFYLSIVYLLGLSLYKALFHEFILWSVFFYMFWAIKFKPKIKSILISFFVAGLFSLTLQTAKSAYRMQVWNNYQGNKLELFVSLMSQSFLADETEVKELDDGIDSNVRLNQGWIISAILDHMPNRQAFVKGETISEAIFAALLPRFLNPSKKRAGGQENFEKFTGLTIGDNTSMGISIIGEAYGNYGKVGGILFLGVWGLFLSYFWFFLLKKFQKNIVLISFVPLIFLQVVKAETELVVVLNHLIKVTILVFGSIWIMANFFGVKFENE